MSQKVPTWVVGASGLLAGELMRLLDGHPALELRGVISREGGRLVRELHPHLRYELRTVPLEEGAQAMAYVAQTQAPLSAVFLGLPHGESAATWKALSAQLGPEAERVRAVDLSADFRLKDPALHVATYGGEAPDPDGREGFVYGLPELWRSRVKEATRVAAPGCFATALQLACVPAAAAGVLDAGATWVLSGVTGSSGSGATPKPTTHHPFRHANLFAYSVGGHRHEAELRQALAELSLAPRLHFVPHSGPLARGIHLTAALPLAKPLTTDQARAIYAERFAGEPFVEVLARGVPEVRSVAGSNRASIGVDVRGEMLTVLVALDNMIKGGSGQALQCMNLMLGFPETLGLSACGSGVC